ncbi:MAG: AAA family ATPase, partial [Methylococcaceae bacterium]
MKILNIYFKNINSLEGESRINFEQAPFSDTGVFAITGPNGSGKSSILDAITLGLYGETFRFDRPARFVMTKRSAECFSEIEFALGNEKYRSSWRVQREGGDADGELQPAQMQLLRLDDGQALADTAQTVCAKITEITGMNFRNFTRSIMLAQGDFAAFLNALDTERMDILEKIISTDIYADYKKEVTDKADKAQSILKQLQQELSAIPLIDAVKREACEHDVIDFKEQIIDFQNEQNDLKQQQALLSRIAGIQEKIGRQKKSLKETKNQLKASQDALDQIDAVNNALLYEQELAAVTEKNQVVKQTRMALASLYDELQQLQNRLGDAAISDSDKQRPFGEQMQTIADIKGQVSFYGGNRQSETALWQSLGLQINEKKSVLATVEDWLKEHAADEILLTDFPETARLKKLRAELAELNQKQKQLSKQSKKTNSSLKNNTSTLANKSKKTIQLEQQLATAEQQLEALAPGKSFDDIDALRVEQQQRVKDYQTLHDLALGHQKLTGGAGFFALFGRKEEPVPDPEALRVDLANLRQEIKREENIKLALDESVFRESLLKRMLADRRHLVDGKPCPLCGALEHPYAKHPPAPSDSVKALVDQQMKLKFLAVRAENLEKQIVAAQKQVERNQAKQFRIQQLNGLWSDLSNRLNAASNDLTIDNLRLMKRLLQAEAEELKNIIALATQYRNQKAGIEKLKALIAKNTA